MNKIDTQITLIKQKKRIGLMTHVVVGYPSLEETLLLVKTMTEGGVDIVELQIPFSDPLADGPTIMHACEQSLANGTKVKDALVIMKKLSEAVSIPLLFMAYYNTIYHYGVEKFCKDASEAGASGLIVPDMALDEESEEHFFENCKKYNLHHIQVISPASTERRLKLNAKIAGGFMYCTARQGTTGARKSLETTLSKYLLKVQDICQLPLAVGFGISTKEHIQALKGRADIAVVGSAIIDIINKTNKKARMEAVKTFITDLIVE